MTIVIWIMKIWTLILFWKDNSKQMADVWIDELLITDENYWKLAGQWTYEEKKKPGRSSWKLRPYLYYYSGLTNGSINNWHEIMTLVKRLVANSYGKAIMKMTNWPMKTNMSNTEAILMVHSANEGENTINQALWFNYEEAIQPMIPVTDEMATN